MQYVDPFNGYGSENVHMAIPIMWGFRFPAFGIMRAVCTKLHENSVLGLQHYFISWIQYVHAAATTTF